MKVIIDTSSLHALVRYYLPFDKDNELESFVKQMLMDGSLSFRLGRVNCEVRRYI